MSLPARLQNPLLGKHLTSVVITPLTMAETGTATAGTAVTVSGRIMGLDNSLEVTKENISPMNSVRGNPVKVEDNASVTVEIYKTNDGTDPDALRAMCITNDYFKVEWIEGTGASAKTHTLYGNRGSNPSNLRGKGQQLASLTIDMADFGTASYTRA